jgi:hypothetical protein
MSLKTPFHLFAFAAMLLLPLLLVRPAIAQEEAPAAESAADDASAEEVPAEEATDETPDANATAEAELALQQGRIADKYARLEQLMLRMAEIDGAANPQRAKLLRQAVGQSKEQLTRLRMEAIVKQLGAKQYQTAVENQKQSRDDLKSLLELLLTEDRGDRNRSEQARVKEYIKELNRIIRMQRGVGGRTENEGDPDRLAKEQGQIGDRTGNLDEEIAGDSESGEGKPSDEEGKPSDGEGKPSDGEGKPSDGEGKPSDGEGKPSDGEGKPSDGEGKPSEGEGKPSDGEGKPSEGEGKPSEGEGKPSEGEGKPSEGEGKPSEGEGKPSEGEGKPSEGEGKPSEGEGKPSEGEGKPSEGEGKPSEGKPSEGQPSQGGQPGQPGESGESESGQQGQQEEMNPARKRIQAAEEKMREAQRKLEEARHSEARDAQREAEAELQKAIAELEEILRQLREEEIERVLAMLESRFRKMLEMELRVYESTIRLAKTPEEQRTPAYDIQAGRLSGDQRKIVVEADRAMLLLREEGSSVAFPEAVDLMREDMDQIANRLAAVKVGRLTQGLEEDVIAALEEMVEALQKAQQDAEQRKQQQQQQQQQPPGDQPLVDQLAELKMIKALQLRVNKRTSRYAQLLEDTEDLVGQVTDSEIGDALQRLSKRQQRIFEVTRDIVLGKNQ